MEKNIDITIQIVNYNTKSYLIDCLHSIFKDLANNPLSFFINILDNSKNDLDDLLDFFSWDEKMLIHVYHSEENGGYGKGHNILSQHTSSRYLLLLNPDILIEEENTIFKLYQRIVEDSQIKVIGPALYNNKGEDQVWDHGESKGCIATIFSHLGESYWKKTSTETECAWVSGAAFMIDRLLFKEIKGFDENFFLYKEEEELCLRIRKRNYTILYYPLTRIKHIGSVVASRKLYFNDSQNYFIQKHFSKKAIYPLIKIVNWILGKFRSYKNI